MVHTQFIYGIIIVIIIQCTCVNAIDVQMNESIVGWSGDNGVQLTCYYTLEDGEEIISVEIKAMNHNSSIMSTVALFKPDRTSLLTISGNYLAGRILLSVIDRSLRQATIRFTNFELLDKRKYQCKVSYFTQNSGLAFEESTATQILVTERQEEKPDKHNCEAPIVVGITAGSVLVIVVVAVLIIALFRKRIWTLQKNQKFEEHQNDNILQEKKSSRNAENITGKVQTQNEHKQFTHSNKKDVTGSMKTNVEDTQALITCQNTTDDVKNSSINTSKGKRNDEECCTDTGKLEKTPAIPLKRYSPILGKTYKDTEDDLNNSTLNEGKRSDKGYGTQSTEGYSDKPMTLTGYSIGTSRKYRNSADDIESWKGNEDKKIGKGYSKPVTQGYCSPSLSSLGRHSTYRTGLPYRDTYCRTYKLTK